MIHGQACALGTCVDNEPRVTPIDYYYDGGLTCWIIAEPGGKIANIKRNPKVSVGIYEPVDHSVEQKSLQIWGEAELINVKNNPDEFYHRVESFGMDEALKGTVEELIQNGEMPGGNEEELFERLLKMMNIIKIVPKKMVLLYLPPGRLPQKKKWEPGSAVIQMVG